MSKTEKLLAAKVGPEFHAESHAAAAALGTCVSKEIKALMKRLIRKAAKQNGPSQ
jgi:hypothetical protein|tara:strand:- start:87 stop:251 length:165 start_codon:yes stop_codon:yes gene_type:complete